MAYRFRKHYTRDEARALLAQVREWLKQVAHLRRKLEKYEKRLKGFMLPGCDLGGESVNTWVRTLAELDTVLREFRQREILIQDIDRGLVDFPSLIGGKEVFLCWEEDEDDIEFWHELDSGYAGREKL